MIKSCSTERLQFSKKKCFKIKPFYRNSTSLVNWKWLVVDERGRFLSLTAYLRIKLVFHSYIANDVANDDFHENSLKINRQELISNYCTTSRLTSLTTNPGINGSFEYANIFGCSS